MGIENPNQKKISTFTGDQLLILIPLCSAGVYFTTFFYFLLYFRKIGIEQNLLNLNLDFYLINGVIPILLVIFSFSLLYFALLYDENFPKLSKKFSIITGHIPLLYLPIAIIFFNFLDSSHMNTFKLVVQIGVIIAGLICVIFYLLLIYKDIPFFKQIWDRDFFSKISIIITIFLLSIILAGSFAELDARNFLKGDSMYSTEISFEFKDNSNSLFVNEIQNQTQLLILHREGYYYITPKQDSNLNKSVIYLIPDGQVISVKTKSLPT